MTPLLILASALAVPVRLVHATDLPLQDLASMRGEAERLLAPAGVGLDWGGAAPLEVRLVECGDPGVPACLPGVLASTITERHGPGASYAVVYVDRVRRLVAPAPHLRGTVLGRVLAHELVHLLAGPGAHAEEGLMAARWQAGAIAGPLDPGNFLNPALRARVRRGSERITSPRRSAHRPVGGPDRLP